MTRPLRRMKKLPQDPFGLQANKGGAKHYHGYAIVLL